MINLFQISVEDQAVYYLGKIFGMVGSILPARDPNLLMGILFKTLNTTALSVGVILIVYITVVGLMKTAQEGEFLGKQWNSLWVPIRTVLGILSLFPTATGYSAIQIVIMWIILQGIGAGDALWKTTINFIAVAGSPYVGVNSSSLFPGQIQLQTQNLFQSLVCQASAKASYEQFGGPATTIDFKYFCGPQMDAAGNVTTPNANNPFCKSMTLDPLTPSGQVPDKTSYRMGPGGGIPQYGSCGVLNYCDVDDKCKADPNNPGASPSAECLTCKAQRSALSVIVPTLGAVADKLVYIDYQYVAFKEGIGAPTPDWAKDYCRANNIPTEQCCVRGLKCTKAFNAYPDTGNTFSDTGTKTAQELYLAYPLKIYLNGSDFINAAVGEYTAALVKAVQQRIENDMKNVDQNSMDKWQQNAINFGWMTAGTVFYQIAGMNAQNRNAMQSFNFTVKQPNPLPDSVGNDMYGYRSNYSASRELISKMVTDNSKASPTFSSVPGSAGTQIQDALSSGSALIFNHFQTKMNDATNPLVSMADFGNSLMMWVKVIFGLAVALVTTFTIITSTMFFFLGTGMPTNPIGEGFKTLVAFMTPLIMLVLTSLFSLGALLGIYVPLIPYMIFTMGAIGWLIACIEAMVAGPIIALGILSPGGQHEVLGRAEPALMMLFNLFLRPSLMIFGMMAAMILSTQVVRFVDTGFQAVMLNVMKNPDLIDQCFFLAIYVSFVVTVLNKTFSLIYLIPERILTWLGQAPQGYGEAEGIQAAKGALEGAASGVGGGMSSGTQSGAGAAAASYGKGQAEAKEETKGKEKEATDKSRHEELSGLLKAKQSGGGGGESKGGGGGKTGGTGSGGSSGSGAPGGP